MAAYLHPGVYIEELPGPQLVSPVSTSNTAFVGLTEKSPGTNKAFLITSWNQYVEMFGGLTWSRQTPFAVYNFFRQGGAICYVVSAEAVPGATSATATANDLTITAAAPGSWGDQLSIEIANYPRLDSDSPDTVKPVFALNVYYRMPAADAARTVSDQLVEYYATANKLDRRQIGGADAYAIETFPGFTRNDLKRIGGAPSNIEARINGGSLFIRVRVAQVDDPKRPDNTAEPTALGSGGGEPGLAIAQLQNALAALDTVSDISLLVTPESVSVADLGLQRNTVLEAVGYCERRPHRDVFYIADAPFGASLEQIVAFKTGSASNDGTVPEGNALNSSYGALYYPWITCLNPANSRNVPMPLSGTMAGTYAAADQAVGPWQVAAGINYGVLRNATGVTRILTDTDQDVLNPNGIDAIRQFPTYGIVAYGGRTLTSDPSLVYISVRRLMIQIEMSLYRSLQWVVFQPNTQRLWGTVTRDITEFLTQMWQAGALFGAAAKEAFQVQCDAGNNPPELQVRGQLIVDIKIRPVFPAEFVIIRIQQATLGSS